jgi:cytochrome c oxidase cbb3-type subunit 4
MDFANDWFAIFLLIALFAIVLVYVFWPSNKKQFDRAAKSILRDEDKPRQ